jgi:hypothetical protein
MTKKTIAVLSLVLLSSPAFAKDLVPLKHGVFVDSEVACSDARVKSKSCCKFTLSNPSQLTN